MRPPPANRHNARVIDRLLSALAGLPRALWRGTVGRLMEPPPVTSTAVTVVEPSEPRSVAGITFRASLVGVGVVLAAYLVYQLRLLLILVFLGILVAAGLYGVARFFERLLPRILAVLLTYVLLLAVIGLVLFLIFPPLIREAIAFSEDLPTIAGQLRSDAIDLINGISPGSGEEIVD